MNVNIQNSLILKFKEFDFFIAFKNYHLSLSTSDNSKNRPKAEIGEE